MRQFIPAARPATTIITMRPAAELAKSITSRFVVYSFLAELCLRYADMAFKRGIDAGVITRKAKTMAKSAMSDIAVLRREIRRSLGENEIDRFEAAHARHCAIMQKDITILYYSMKQWLDNNNEDNSIVKAELLSAEALVYGLTTYYSELINYISRNGRSIDLRMCDASPILSKIDRTLELIGTKKAQKDDQITLAWKIIVKKIGCEETLNQIIKGLI